MNETPIEEPLEEPLDKPLKESRVRGVRLERAEDTGETRVVKSFHNPDLIGRVKNRLRAKHEFTLLERLRKAGVAVPCPIAVRRRGGAWEVVMEWLSDTVTLHDAMTAVVPWPTPSQRVAGPLGKILAGGHAAGLDHPDMHANNVMLDAKGGVWLIDFHQASLRRSVNLRILERDLCELCAAGRELISPRFRARFLVSWLRNLPEHLRRLLPQDIHGWARDIEDRARTRRRATAKERARRWLRESGVCRRVEDGDLRAFESKALPEGWTRSLRRALHRMGQIPSGRLQSLAPGEELRPAPDRALLRIVEDDRETLVAPWFAAARLQMHWIASLEPVTLVEDQPRPWAVFGAPADAQPLDIVANRRRGRARRRLVRHVGRLLGSLHDRGLAISNLSAEQVWISSDRALFGMVSELTDLHPSQRRLQWRGLVDTFGPLSARDRALFCAAYVKAHLHGPREQNRLRQELRAG